MTSLITLNDAAFGYAGEPVLNHIDLSIEPGEFIGLIGPNGAGKSTLFKGLLKLLTPLDGRVTHAPELTRRIGYVPQRDTLDPIYPLTAWDVVRMGIEGSMPWYRWAGATEKRTVRSCLEKVGMYEFRDHPFAELSGGQRQRVLIARALAGNPLLLVLDEPTSGIDPVAEESVLALLKKLNRDAGLTILMVSHHLHALRACAQRMLVVHHGKVLSGPAEDFLTPARIGEFLEGAL